MTQPSPEHLLSRLARFPLGLPPPPDGERRAWEAARRDLEARGHQVAMQPDGSWKLACAREHFDPEQFETLRRGRFGFDLEVWEQIDSTNRRAWEGVEEGKLPGWVVLAEEQVAGRGRQGRRWVCPAHAGLLFSLVLPARLASSSRPQLLPLALALGACEALRSATRRDVRLKWPNDLMLHERKLAGLLLEARPGSSTVVVVGCGINVRVSRQHLVAPADQRAASLHEDPRPLSSREELLSHVLAGMERRFEDWRASRDALLLQEWGALDLLPGRQVEAHLPEGVEQGEVLGLNDAGLLRLRLQSGEVRALAAGEVHLQ